MNPKEVIIALVDKLAPTPSPEWETYIQNVRKGMEKNVPVFGMGERAIFDFYGKNAKKKVEQGRVRLPLEGVESEVSYHITRKPDGSFTVVKEGIFPYAG